MSRQAYGRRTRTFPDRQRAMWRLDARQCSEHVQLETVLLPFGSMVLLFKLDLQSFSLTGVCIV